MVAGTRVKSLVGALVFSVALGGACAPAAFGQTPPGSTTTKTADQADPPVDLVDVIKKLRRKGPPASTPAEPWDYRKRMIAFAPVISYKPASGMALGAAGNIAFYAGSPDTTPITSAVISATFSSKKQTAISVRFNASTDRDQWRLKGDNQFQWTSQDTYGLGASSGTDSKVNAKFNYFRVYETAYYALRGPVHAGMGFHFNVHTNVRPGDGADDAWSDSAYVTYSETHGLALDSQRSAGVSLDMLVDTRDHAINASRGWMAEASYRPFFENFLGGDSAWQELFFDVRTYAPLTKDARHKIAVWLYGDLVMAGVAPYFDLPAIGTDTYGRSGRGYTAGRYRGERLVYGEVEYRGTLTRNGLLGVVAFVNTTTLSSAETGERLFDAWAPAGGAGLRILFNKRSKTNLCIDFGVGKQGSRGLYLSIQEAF